jgi:hypothetical protein
MSVGVQRHKRTGTRVAFAVVVAVVLLLVLAQIFLPLAAERVLRDRIKPYGALQSVSISAWPAVQLLWGKADSASATAGSLHMTTAQMSKLVWESRGVHDLNFTARRFAVKVPGLPNDLVLRDLTTRKHGSSMSMHATLTQADLTAALPSGVAVQPVASGGGQVEMHVTGALFGLQASINALARPLEGRLVAEPRGLPFGGFTTVTLFEDSHLKVEALGVTVNSEQPLTYGVSLRASLR